MNSRGREEGQGAPRMAQNIVYANLRLPDSAPGSLQQVSDGQECPYAELQVKPQDTNDARGHTSSGKSCGFRKRGAVLVAVLAAIILLLAMAGWLIGKNYPIANSSQNSTTLSQSSPQQPTPLSPSPEEALGCPKRWEKHGRKCYFFFRNTRKDENIFRKQCTDMGSDLVVIASKEELDYLLEKSEHDYYFLGLMYSLEEHKWNWINNEDHDPAMFDIKSTNFQDYLCTAIGHGEVRRAPCDGGHNTRNMCEQPATITKRLQKES